LRCQARTGDACEQRIWENYRAPVDQVTVAGSCSWTVCAVCAVQGGQIIPVLDTGENGSSLTGLAPFKKKLTGLAES
jgi:hypothetical protein